MKQIKGNALAWAREEDHAMIHVCNNKGGYGGGRTALATQIRKVSQSAYTNYLTHYSQGGTASASDCRSFINLIAQDGYGARGKGVKYLREDWLKSSLEAVRLAYFDNYQKGDPTTIVVPHNMGCDRAGGNWKEVIQIVEDVLGDYFKILVVEYDGG
jgi:hypothetical protein